MGRGPAADWHDDLAEQAVDRAAKELETAAPDLEVVARVVRPRDVPSRAIPLAELGCEGTCRFEKPHPGVDMGASLAAVTINRDTAAVSVTRLVLVHDVGRMVNPSSSRGSSSGRRRREAAGGCSRSSPTTRRGS